MEHFLRLIQGKPSDSRNTFRVGEGMRKIEYLYCSGREKFSLTGLLWNTQPFTLTVGSESQPQWKHTGIVFPFVKLKGVPERDR